MSNYNVYKIEFSWSGDANKDKYGKWQNINRVTYLLGNDLQDCELTLKARMPGGLLIKTAEEFPVEIITPEIMKSLFAEFYHVFKKIYEDREQEQAKQKTEMEKQLKEAKKNWYTQDKIINDGGEARKEDASKIWSEGY